MTEPLMSYTYYIDSAKRSSGTTTDLIINLDPIVNLQSKDGMFKIVVHGCSIPFSFYQLYSGINTVQAVFTDTSGQTKTSTITLTAGNYNAITVLNELRDKLIAEAQVSSGLYTGFTPTLTFTYDSTLSKDTFQMTAPALASIQLNFSTSRLLGGFFGCSTNKLISTTSTPVSDKVVVVNPVNTLYLRCSTLKQYRNREYVVESNVYSDILYNIPVLTGQNTYIQYNANSPEVFIVNDNISQINFYLTTNLDYNPIDLQGLDWSFRFTIFEVPVKGFIPRQSTLNTLQPVPISNEPPDELKKLEEQKNEILSKLEKYKKKLESP